jgi:hypothetical protein
MARPSENELVTFLRMDPAQAAIHADSLRVRILRSKSIQAMASGLVTATAGVLPVPVAEIVAPETILCAVGWGLRAAMADKVNAVVRLPVLTVQPDGHGGVAQEEDSLRTEGASSSRKATAKVQLAAPRSKADSNDDGGDGSGA